MSFHITFAARSVSEARAKLDQHHAPAAVKALVEKALDAIPAPRSSPPATEEVGASTAGVGMQVRVNRSPTPREAFGVWVEVWGHIADAGDLGVSEIQRFLVRPLVAP